MKSEILYSALFLNFNTARTVNAVLDDPKKVREAVKHACFHWNLGKHLQAFYQLIALVATCAHIQLYTKAT